MWPINFYIQRMLWESAHSLQAEEKNSIDAETMKYEISLERAQRRGKERGACSRHISGCGVLSQEETQNLKIGGKGEGGIFIGVKVSKNKHHWMVWWLGL